MRFSIAAAALAVGFSVAAYAADAPATAPAKMPAFTIVRGSVLSFDGKTLSIKTNDGKVVTAPVGPKTRYAAVEARTFEQLKPTDFVGITSSDGPNGHLVAEEIHILPGVMGEGQYGWDHHPDSTSAPTRAGSMTNGTVQPSGGSMMMGGGGMMSGSGGSMMSGNSMQGGMMRSGSMTNGTVTTGGSHQLTVTFHGSEMKNGKCTGHALPPPAPGCTGTAIVDVTPKTYIQALVPATAADVKPGLAVVAFAPTGPDGAVIGFGSATVEKNGVKPQM